MKDGFADLFFEVSDHFAVYRAGTEDHILRLRRLIQESDHLAPHELDGNAWEMYLKQRGQ